MLRVVETGVDGVCFQDLRFQVFNVFKRLRFRRGGKEANHALKDRTRQDLESTHSKYLRNCVYCFFKSTSVITFDNGSGVIDKINDKSTIEATLKNKQNPFKLQKATDCGTFCS